MRLVMYYMLPLIHGILDKILNVPFHRSRHVILHCIIGRIIKLQFLNIFTSINSLLTKLRKNFLHIFLFFTITLKNRVELFYYLTNFLSLTTRIKKNNK